MSETPKYKIGDRVRIINDATNHIGEPCDGLEGIVDDDNRIPHINLDDGRSHAFCECDLELIPEQLTPEVCKDKAKDFMSTERMATDEDREGLEELVKDATAILPTDSEARKQVPIYSGFMAYFPRAIAAVAHQSWLGNEKHNPGQHLHWAKDKSSDHLDCVARHMIDQLDPNLNEIEEKTATAWRAMADLETALEK